MPQFVNGEKVKFSFCSFIWVVIAFQFVDVFIQHFQEYIVYCFLEPARSYQRIRVVGCI